MTLIKTPPIYEDTLLCSSLLCYLLLLTYEGYHSEYFMESNKKESI